ncbi:hypothetical protein FH609_005955 [Streptomyces sp. 3MP-14]|uniref:Uncharacterized protein n=1 Tax=Streptomyces mimosae TaxID=2586635 RepID=A0A5N6AQB0_9ACTN|nr:MULTISPECIES: hypothetical protein [Streptomyces]KAB8169818.1 hypothetical protein FH607_003635 [Streptomyces mimosae]KAB8178566.1 hypothetical protein FH609_005955 [Streptomyces sp. 3MP-14]
MSAVGVHGTGARGARVGRAGATRGVGALSAFAALAALAGGGCTLDERAGPGEELLAALGEVRYESPPPTGLTFVNAARANELRAEDPERFAFVEALGTPLLNLRDLPAERYGLDPDRAETTVTVDFAAPFGQWDGDFDAAEIREQLAADGFTERETDAGPVWVNHDRGLGLMVEDDRIRWGDEQLDPSRTEAVGEPLAEQEVYRDLAACLGTVYRADLVQAAEGAEVPVYAVGHRAEAADDTSTVLCAVTEDEATAEAALERLREEIEEGQTRYAGAEAAPLEAEGGSPGVRVTVPDRPEQRPGRLLAEDTDLTDALRTL